MTRYTKRSKQMDAEAQHETESPANPDCSPEMLERIRHEIAELFRHANHDHPMISELFRLCLQRRIRQAGEKH